MQRAVRNAAWSATKTRQYDPESRPRMPFRPSAIRGHSTVSSNQSRHATTTRSTRVEMGAKELEIQPIRAVLPACNARHSITGTAPSFLRISFSDRYQQHVDLCGNRRKSIVERNENTSVTCRGNTSSAISLRCNQGTFDGGATYRQYPTNQSRPPDTQRAVVGSRCINVQHADGHSRAAPTCSDTRVAAGLHPSFVMCVEDRLPGSGIWIGTK